LVLQHGNTVWVQNGGPLFVAAVTQDVSARADLAMRLPGESVLLLFPDHATAARALGDETAARALGEVMAARALGEDEPIAGPDEDDHSGDMIVCGGLLIDPLRLDVTWNGTPLRLTRLERAVLASLAQPPVRAWSYEYLHHAAWGDAWLGDTSALHATVKRLRRKLRDAGVTIVLESIRGVGFRLDIEVGATAIDETGATAIDGAGATAIDGAALRP
jgi:DNA-binding winged helix-turn-helix (wHTH) protein